VRSAGVATLVAFGVVVAACSSGGGSNAGSRDELCELVADLAATADAVETADVGDPESFQRALDDAVTRYVETVRRLRPLVPERLHDEVDHLEAAAEQHDFDEALAARRALAADEATACTSATTTSTQASG
jgi:hypothetical protein